VPEPELGLNLPAWWEPLTVPTWVPGVRGDIAVRDAIAGHVSVQSDPAGDGSPLPHSLVYFADWESAAPLDALADILARAKESVPVFVVLPEGAFNASRNELERRLGPARDRIPARVELTEDDQGGWTRVFGVARAPSLYVIKDGREVVWWQEGEPDPAAVVSALTERLRPPAASRFRPLRLAVSPGDRAPDVSFRDEAANPFAIRRLRGSRILLNFWQSWSAPCLAELRRLEGVHREADQSLFIAGFHGGKDAKSIDRVRRELGISFPLVDDSEQRTARRYGVRCWPTTVSIGPEGQVDHVQLGLSRPDGDTSAQGSRGVTGPESAP
jgi:peroxiredoxin